MSLQKSSQTLLQSDGGEQSISVYGGDLKPETVARCVAKVKAAFPALTKDFFTVFIDRLKDKGFSDERLNEAVNNVIDNCQYPTPTLANFLSFDKRVKVLSYDELCSKVYKLEVKFDDYTPITINGNRFYIKKSDKVLYNLPDEV